MTTDEAIVEAQDLLRDEANSLACILDNKSSGLPHRALVAIRREVQRFRLVADTLDQLLPAKTEIEDP